MNTKPLSIVFLFSLLLFSCSNSTTQIGDNTFVHNGKVYRIIDNEVREIGDLNSSIKKLELFQPKQRDLGNASLSYVKQGAYASLKALYRGNFLYYSMTISGLNDMKENYSNGALTISFKDEYGFILHSVEVPRSELIGMVGDDGKVLNFHYDGKTEMSTDINSAIKSYDISSSINRRAANLFNPY